MTQFFLDVHPEYQAGLDFNRVKAEGYGAAIVKATQGGSFVAPGFGPYFRRVEAAKLIGGMYHFLDASASAEDQVKNFMAVVQGAGGFKNRILAVDFEAHGDMSPANITLKVFVTLLRKRVGDHPIVLYTNKNFWESGSPSGPFANYGADYLWAAHYADMDRHDDPKAHFRALEGWGWDTIGGKKADIHQFTSTGKVAGQYLDVNASAVDLKALAQGKPEPQAKPYKVVVGSYATRRQAEAELPGLAQLGVPAKVEGPKEPAEPEKPKVVLKRGQGKDGSGSYVRAHPTNYVWREDVGKLAHRVANDPRWVGKVWLNTYDWHPPHDPPNITQRYDQTSFDVWGFGGRGSSLDPQLGDRIFAELFDDPHKPDISWCIYKGRMWVKGSGWQPAPDGPVGSDPDHLWHIHITYV